MTDRLIRITTALAVTAVAVVAASSRTSTLERRLASSTAMDAAQSSPSTVNGNSRAAAPDSPCECTNS